MSNKRGFESAFDDEMDDAMEGLQQPWGGEPSNADALFQQANNVLEQMISANAPNYPPLQFGRPPLDSATAPTLHEPPPHVPPWLAQVPQRVPEQCPVGQLQAWLQALCAGAWPLLAAATAAFLFLVA